MTTYSHIYEMSEILTTPTEGTVELKIDKDDAKFDTLDTCIKEVTGFIEDCKGIVDKVGLPWPGPDIKETSAVELFVQPFSGDWNKIIACGDAVNKSGKALKKVALNLTAALAQLSGAEHMTGAEPWQGNAATSFNVHILGHVAVYTAAGYVVEQGKLVFDGISEVCQWVADKVVELIDTGLDILEWLAKKIARYGRAWVGAVQLAADVVMDGWDAIQDIIDMLGSLYETIEAVFDLHDAVTSWVETIPAELEVFQGLLDEMKKIPSVVDTPLLTTAQLAKGITDTGNEAQSVIDDRAQARKDVEEATDRLEELGDDVEEPGISDEMEDVEVPEVETE